MESALGSILPQAIGVAISPVPIIAVILMLVLGMLLFGQGLGGLIG